MLKGQAAIAAEDGYVQLFEYMAMELLGPRTAEQKTDGAGVMVKTAIGVVDQAVRRIRIRASYSTE